jgi:hypothetical protein
VLAHIAEPSGKPLGQSLAVRRLALPGYAEMIRLDELGPGDQGWWGLRISMA